MHSKIRPLQADNNAPTEPASLHLERSISANAGAKEKLSAMRKLHLNSIALIFVGILSASDDWPLFCVNK